MHIYITTKNVRDEGGLHVFFFQSVWLVLVIRSGIKMLYFDCILGNLLLDFNGKSLVHF